ncbi:hypothetical protein NXY56_002929 [Leishmania guyanensis]
MTELAERRPPLATPGERAVSCGGSDGAAAIAGESPPPLPPAPWRAGDGASSLDPGRCGSHPHSKSRATDAHGVARQPSASDPDVASETRAGDREVWTSRECHESPAAVSLRDGAAAALGWTGRIVVSPHQLIAQPTLRRGRRKGERWIGGAVRHL